MFGKGIITTVIEFLAACATVTATAIIFGGAAALYIVAVWLLVTAWAINH